MQLKDFLRHALLVGIFAVPFIPFIITSSMFFPFITGKAFAFRILTELLLGGWIILALLDVRFRPKFSWIFAALVAFVAIIFVADLGSENLFKSFWSNFERMEGFVTLAHLFVYFLVLGSVLNTEKLWGRFAATSIGASVLMALYGVVQLLGFIKINQGGTRLDGTFGNATYLAIYMLFHVFITALLLLKWRGNFSQPKADEPQTQSVWWIKWLLVGAIALQIFTLVQTATRGAVLGLVGGVLLAAILLALFERENMKLRKVSAAVLIAVLVVVGGFFSIKNTSLVKSNEILERIASISLEQKTVQARFFVWNMALQGFKERPLLGWGQESFNFVFNKYYNPKMFDQEPWFDRVHNIVLDWVIAGGILGLLAYLSIPLAVLYYLWIYKRSQKLFTLAEKSIFTGLLAAYGFYNLFVFDNIGSYLLFFGVLAYIHFRVTPVVPNQPLLRKEISAKTISTIVAPLIGIAILVVVYFVNIPAIISNQNLIRALSPQSTSGLSKNIELFKKVLTYNTIGRQEAREQLIQFSMRFLRDNRVSVEDRQEFFNLSVASMREEIDRSPNDARLLVFLGTFLNNAGSPNNARPFLERARKLSPNKQTMYFALAATEIAQMQYDTALTLYKTAFELEPSFDLARTRYAVGATYAGERTLAESLLVEKFGTDIIDNGNLLQAYIDTGQNDKVLALWQLRAEKNPNDAQIKLSLAAAYLAVGNRTQAIEEIKRFKELSPQNSEQADFFIREIRAGRNP